MTMLASQITSLPVVCSIVYSDVNQRKHQSSASLAFVREIHRGPVNFPHKWPVTRKMFPFDDVIMSIQYPNQLGEMSYSVTVVSCKKKHHTQLYQMQTYDVRNTPRDVNFCTGICTFDPPPPPPKKKKKKKTTKKNNNPPPPKPPQKKPTTHTITHKQKTTTKQTKRNTFRKGRWYS